MFHTIVILGTILLYYNNNIIMDVAACIYTDHIIPAYCTGTYLSVDPIIRIAAIASTTPNCE